MRLVVGLGNVGAQYRSTRHNAGFMVVDKIAARHNATWKNEPRLRADVANIELEGEDILIAKPTTMMNASGESTQRLMQRYRVPASDVWVIFDDVDTPFGRLRLRRGGGSSGHQGINSTIGSIGSDFIRAKFGISLNDRKIEASEVYVLKPFTETEQNVLDQIVEQAAKEIEARLPSDVPEAETIQLIASPSVGMS